MGKGKLFSLKEQFLLLREEEKASWEHITEICNAAEMVQEPDSMHLILPYVSDTILRNRVLSSIELLDAESINSQRGMSIEDVDTSWSRLSKLTL